MQIPYLLIFSGLWRREKYYHTDHLGSASYITDDRAKVVQQLAYMPYGEEWADIRDDNAYSGSAYKFNGKEKDDETSYSYYGARYYTDRLSIWLSVDPLADKYPHLSPYAYCADNPVMLVDPDGREIKITGSKKNIQQYVQMLNQLTGNTYSWNSKTKLLTRISTLNTETNSNMSGELSLLIEAAINSDNVINMSIVNNSDKVLFDSYQNAKIDIGDLAKCEDRAFAAGLIGHIVKERLETAGNEGYGNVANRTMENFEQTHNMALSTEGSIVTSMLGVPYTTRQEETQIDKNSSNTAFHYNITVKYGQVGYSYSHNMKAIYQGGNDGVLRIYPKTVRKGGTILTPIRRINE